MNNPKVSVIIPTYNRSGQVCDCVESVLKSTYDNIEVIVSDNASSDDTITALEQRFGDRVIIIALEVNKMASGGRNEGIKRASGDYLLFLDNDNLITGEMIERLVNFAENHTRVGLVGPITLQANENNVIWTASGHISEWTSRPSDLFARKRLDEVGPVEPFYETYYSPNAMMISREAIEAVGGFDSSYFAMYEESDIGYRIHLAGFNEYIVTDAITYHYETVAKDGNLELRKLGAWPAERAFHFAKNRFVYMKKYSKWYQWIVFLICFSWIYTFYYTYKALSCKEKEVAKAWIEGTRYGLWHKVDKSLKVDIYAE